ncbi:Ferrichrome-iron receptor [plant metagenome]|uniref:Ferrichrome-iron receptor n=1 Tax=plant metagenome TaxID=1297885 RepID=A0A484SNA0_9ZZZZ
MSSRNSTLIPTRLFLALGWVPALALAQQAQPPVTSLPQITVQGQALSETATGPVQGYSAQRSATATKTDTPLIETAQSVTVVTRDQMVDQGATSIQEALGYAAGVRGDAYGVDSRSDSARIRGSSPDTYLDGLRQNFDYYTSTTRTEPFLLERLEVLRGPSAMLYGQGSTAGIINMVSKRPQADFQGEVGVQYGSHGRKQAQFDITGPATADGKLLYRLVALKRDADTQVHHVPDDRSLVAPSLTWQPSAATSFTVQALWQDDKSGSTAQFMPWSGMRTDNPNGRVPTYRFIGEPDRDKYDSNRRSIGWLFEHRFNDNWSVSQGVRHARNKNDYFTTYADSFSDPGGFAIDPVDQRVIGRYLSDSITKVRMDTADQHLKGKLKTGIVTHDILLGFDWTQYRRDKQSSGYVPPALNPIDAYNPVYGNYVSTPLTDEPRFKQRQSGIYLQNQMKFGQNWIVTAGLRHDRARTQLDGSQEDKDSATTKRLGVMYAADNGWSPYVSYSESFTPVASTTSGAEIKTYKPLRGEQWEVGVKHQSADGRSLFTASVYTLGEKNQLTPDPVNPLSSVQTGKTRTRGLELEWRGSPAANLDLIAHYNYINLDEKLEGIPKHQASAWAKYRFAIADVHGFSAGAGVRWMSKFTDGNAPETASVVLLDGLLAYETNKWRYALNVNNLTDKTYVATCLSRGDCWYGARRNIIASASYKF